MKNRPHGLIAIVINLMALSVGWIVDGRKWRHIKQWTMENIEWHRLKNL